MAELMKENDLQRAVIQLAQMLGCKVHHCRPARRRDGSWGTPIEGDAGFVDLVLVGPRGVLYRELKGPRGSLSVEQTAWLYALAKAGQDAAVWTPREWPEPIMSELRGVR